MKLDNELLKAIALGVTMYSATACTEDHKVALDPDDCVEGCEEKCVGECINKSDESYTPDYASCPGCGLG